MRISQAVDIDAAETNRTGPAVCGLSVSADRSAQLQRHPENEPTDSLANAFMFSEVSVHRVQIKDSR